MHTPTPSYIPVLCIHLLPDLPLCQPTSDKACRQLWLPLSSPTPHPPATESLAFKCHKPGSSHFPACPTAILVQAHPPLLPPDALLCFSQPLALIVSLQHSTRGVLPQCRSGGALLSPSPSATVSLTVMAKSPQLPVRLHLAHLFGPPSTSPTLSPLSSPSTLLSLPPHSTLDSLLLLKLAGSMSPQGLCTYYSWPRQHLTQIYHWGLIPYLLQQ